MNVTRNQWWPFVFGIGNSEEGGNTKEDFIAYETVAGLVGIR